ncbi:MAG: MFS transporter [Candidatus Pacebacteria bacterium]|nr:MFS transporter [Candidatus Paceibacterota bacterium]
MFFIRGKKPQWLVLLSFAVISFLISFADAIMSYISPIFIEAQVSSTFIMGLIFAFSSVVGIICDIVFPKIFTNKSHFFFLKVTLLSAILFPTTFLFFPQHIMTLFLAMAIWGVYFELNMFSSFQFVNSYIHLSEHTKAWGILQAFHSGAYALGPLLAVHLLSSSFELGFTAVLFFLGIALFLTLFFRIVFINPHSHRNQKKELHKSWISEFKVWKILFKSVWPLLALQLIVSSVDASFWTIGALLMQSLSQESSLGSFLLTAYILPATFVGLFLTKLTLPIGKKKTALICSALAGVALGTYVLLHSVVVILVVTLLVSFFMGIAVPEMKATFEDYISRLKDDGNELIGLQGSSSSFAYVIGPIVATFLASIIGIKGAFSLLGISLAIISLGLLFVTPKKIRMPQRELNEIL